MKNEEDLRVHVIPSKTAALAQGVRGSLSEGLAYHRLGRLEEAVGCYDRVLAFVNDLKLEIASIADNPAQG